MRSSLSASLAPAVAIRGASAAGIDPATGVETDDLYTPAVAAALRRGWDYLATRQQANGGFPGAMGGNVAVVSLAGLAWLAGGGLPGRGPHGQRIDRAIDFVAGACQENGYIARPDEESGRAMYGHGFGALFLAEVIGMTDRQDLAAKLRAATALIVRSQNIEGGWRYTPQPIDADLSVTICQVMALRAARNAGLYVPAETIERSVDYTRRSQNVDGGFLYRLQGGDSRFPLTAGAIVALQNAGYYDARELDAAYEYLEQRLQVNLSPVASNYFFYAHYYSVQAFWQRGGPSFVRWYTALRDTLLRMQSQDGGWNDHVGRDYGTAMACLILSTPRSHLPIFQR